MFNLYRFPSLGRHRAAARPVDPGHKPRLGRVLCAATLLIFALPALAIQPVQPGQHAAHSLTQPVVSPALHVLPDVSTTQSLAPEAATRSGVATFINDVGGTWEVRWDQLSNRPNVIQGSGVALIPGRGNKLRNQDLGLAAGQAVTLERVASRLTDFMQQQQDLLKINGMDLRLNPAGSGPTGLHNTHWTVRFDQYYQGVKVDNAYVYFRISHGNIVQFGTHRVAPVNLNAKPAMDAQAAFTTVFSKIPFQGSVQLAQVLEPGELLVLPTMATPQPRGTRFTGVPGQGYGHVLAWRFVFQLDGDHATWEVFANAQTNQLLEVRDLTEYAQATVSGGVRMGRTTVPDTEVPLPFVSVTNGGQKVTDVDGHYDYTGGAASTSLNGRYFTISDNCGTVSLSNSSDGNLDFGTSGGTDCTTPGSGGAGNTHATRTGFYHLTMINRTAATYLPGNSWVDSTVPVNVNINDTCNAYWNGYSLNFYKSGGGCANTGEIPGVFLHEWGHGIDSNTGGAAPESGSGEAVGDTFAMLYTETGCIGDGFYPNDPDECTGVRWPKAYSVHDQEPGYPIAKPSTILQFGNYGCPYFTPSGQPYQGVMGYEGHRESLIISSAQWDLIQNLIDEYGPEQGWSEMKEMWYGSLYASKSAYQIVSGGRCNPEAEIDGCAASNWYTALLAADDDDGNLSNGTPNACRIWDAYNVHSMACGARPSCTGGADADFIIGTNTPRIAICVPSDAVYTIDIGARMGFSNPVTLSVGTLPSGVTASFAANPVAPGSSTQMTLTAAPGTAAGDYSVVVTGTAQDSPGHDMTVHLVVNDGPPGTPVLQAPLDGAFDLPPSPTLSWNAVADAESYKIEIATDAGFGNVIVSQFGITGTSYKAQSLDLNSTYYWRVTALNKCGIGAASPAFSFTTVLPESRKVIGSVSGLLGDSVTLQLNGAEEVTVSSNTAFIFPGGILDGQTYAVTVSDQPNNPDQTCTVQNGSGTIQGENVSDVKVTCGPLVAGFTVGGTVAGLTGSGLVLQLNGANDLTVNGASFTFAAQLQDGAGYTVTVLDQPQGPAQYCAISNGSGTIAGANVSDVTITCGDDVIFADGFDGVSAH